METSSERIFMCMFVLRIVNCLKLESVSTERNEVLLLNALLLLFP